MGTNSPNELGIYDMSGNVWEWCSDWHSWDTYANSSQVDPEGPSDGVMRVRRGGSFNFVDSVAFCTWFRVMNTPESRGPILGLRLCL